jgi:hypothetical protein
MPTHRHAKSSCQNPLPKTSTSRLSAKDKPLPSACRSNGRERLCRSAAEIRGLLSIRIWKQKKSPLHRQENSRTCHFSLPIGPHTRPPVRGTGYETIEFFRPEMGKSHRRFRVHLRRENQLGTSFANTKKLSQPFVFRSQATSFGKRGSQQVSSILRFHFQINALPQSHNLSCKKSPIEHEDGPTRGGSNHADPSRALAMS